MSLLPIDFSPTAIPWKHSSGSQPETASLIGISADPNRGDLHSDYTSATVLCLPSLFVYISFCLSSSRLTVLVNSSTYSHLFNLSSSSPLCSMMEPAEVTYIQLRAGNIHFSPVHLNELPLNPLERNLQKLCLVLFDMLPWWATLYILSIVQGTPERYCFLCILLIRISIHNKIFTTKFSQMIHI